MKHISSVSGVFLLLSTASAFATDHNSNPIKAAAAASAKDSSSYSVPALKAQEVSEPEMAAAPSGVPTVDDIKDVCSLPKDLRKKLKADADKYVEISDTDKKNVTAVSHAMEAAYEKYQTQKMTGGQMVVEVGKDVADGWLTWYLLRSGIKDLKGLGFLAGIAGEVKENVVLRKVVGQVGGESIVDGSVKIGVGAYWGYTSGHALYLKYEQYQAAKTELDKNLRLLTRNHEVYLKMSLALTKCVD